MLRSEANAIEWSNFLDIFRFLYGVARMRDWSQTTVEARMRGGGGLGVFLHANGRKIDFGIDEGELWV